MTTTTTSSSTPDWQQRIIGEDVDMQPPFRLLVRPPQFPQGKTATAIESMIFMMKWIFDQSRAMEIQSQLNSEVKYKRIVHLIFVNNNLIEGDQWRDRLFTRGVQNMKIFSSKSDISDSDTINKLITQGEFVRGKYVQVDYVLMCTNSTRLSNFTGEATGDSLLQRLQAFRPDTAVMCWFDEVDKFVKLLKDHIPKFQRYTNVLSLNGITATAYNKFWDIMHECGYYDVEIIGQLPEPSEYVTLADHEVIFTDEITTKNPALNFEIILKNPGFILSHTSPEGETTVTVLPDLSKNTGCIIFVPGESARKSHDNIKDISLDYGKNALVINGVTKAYYRASDKKSIEISDYKEEQIKKQDKELRNGKVIPPENLFRNMTAMDVAVKMYHDPSLLLKEADLVITGFYCVERGVTFNRPDFQFKYAILTPYHYKEGSKEIESIVQLAGRTHGRKGWVQHITILAPQYIVETVNKSISELIAFLRTAPTSINHASIFRETNGIPIMCTLEPEIVKSLIDFGKVNTQVKKVLIEQLLKAAYNSGKIQIIGDKNKDIPNHLPFSFDGYEFDGKRIVEDEAKAKNYRFPQFYEHYIKQKIYGQSICKGKYTIDITNIAIKIDDETILAPGTAFISFAFNERIPESE